MAAEEPTLVKDWPGGRKGLKVGILERPEGAGVRGDRDVAFG